MPFNTKCETNILSLTITYWQQTAQTPCDAVNLDGAGIIDMWDLDWMFDYWLIDCGQ